MDRKDIEGKKGGMSNQVEPDERNPNKAAVRNTDMESMAANRNQARAGGTEKGAKPPAGAKRQAN